jgi:hypothetical protein
MLFSELSCGSSPGAAYQRTPARPAFFFLHGGGARIAASEPDVGVRFRRVLVAIDRTNVRVSIERLKGLTHLGGHLAEPLRLRNSTPGLKSFSCAGWSQHPPPLAGYGSCPPERQKMAVVASLVPPLSSNQGLAPVCRKPLEVDR